MSDKSVECECDWVVEEGGRYKDPSLMGSHRSLGPYGVSILKKVGCTFLEFSGKKDRWHVLIYHVFRTGRILKNWQQRSRETVGRTFLFIKKHKTNGWSLLVTFSLANAWVLSESFLWSEVHLYKGSLVHDASPRTLQ